MLVELAVVLVILATVAFVYLKGSVISAFLLLINTFIASVVAFAYFETLGRIVIGYGLLVEWAFAAVFVLIFVLALAILHAVSDKLAPIDIYFGDFSDRAIRSLIAAFAGFVIAGIILTALAMMPIGKWPYERFIAQGRITRQAEPEPDKSLILNADGFVTNFSSWLSRGSMSGKKSLAVFHPDLLNEMYLNRIGSDEENSPVAGSQAIEVKAAWFTETELISASDNQPLTEGSGKKAVIVQTGIDGRGIKEGGILTEQGSAAFTMSQVRLVCKDSDSADNLGGGGQVVYPAGFVREGNIVEQKNLSDKIKLNISDFSDGLKWFDFVFYIPADTMPIMLQFKQNPVDSVRLTSDGGKPSSSDSIQPQ